MCCAVAAAYQHSYTAVSCLVRSLPAVSGRFQHHEQRLPPSVTRRLQAQQHHGLFRIFLETKLGPFVDSGIVSALKEATVCLNCILKRTSSCSPQSSLTTFSPVVTSDAAHHEGWRTQRQPPPPLPTPTPQTRDKGRQERQVIPQQMTFNGGVGAKKEPDAFCFIFFLYEPNTDLQPPPVVKLSS